MNEYTLSRLRSDLDAALENYALWPQHADYWLPIIAGFQTQIDQITGAIQQKTPTAGDVQGSNVILFRPRARVESIG